ncbi:MULTISPECIES: hypothetical protein [Ralstonia solanacearum species complex]|uniref:hypothetical protein n=1 Tax=Ralstonia solanacearum species complex TaxID=3116862 RepID=UPI0013C32156|nr:hypothetical protein [Ralstonia solanacearum]
MNLTIDRNGMLADNGWDAREPGWTTERLERMVTPLLRGEHERSGIVRRPRKK